jgi:lipoprotein NlpI
MSLSLTLLLLCVQDQPSAGEQIIARAQRLADAGESKEALTLVSAFLAKNPRDPKVLAFRAKLHEARRDFQPAFDDLTALIAVKSTAELHDRRGGVAFMLGKFDQSLRDFDRAIELDPKRAAGHWRRGITCYYAGKFDEGRKQFESYEAVDTNDVENAIWHFLCVARSQGVEKARQKLLKIGADKRQPMMAVYALFGGKAKPEDVIKAAEQGDPDADQLNRQRFYGHLYLGLYAETLGDRNLARKHLEQAVKHRIEHYMWDVARVHYDLLMKGDGAK